MSDTNDNISRFGHVALAQALAYTSREWAWEFLRENSQFVDAWKQATANFEISDVTDLRRKIVEQGAVSTLSRFGVRYSSAPEQDARTAAVFWSPEMTADVLRLYAICQCKGLATPPLFHLTTVACQVTTLSGADGVQHLLFQDGARALQVRVAGASLDEPVHLFAEAIVHPDQEPAYLRALHCFEDLRLTGRLLERHFATEPYGRRLAEVLDAIKVSRVKPRHRDIAVALYGEARVERDWVNPQSGLRDHVRNTLKRGRYLVSGGYREFLA